MSKVTWVPTALCLFGFLTAEAVAQQTQPQTPRQTPPRTADQQQDRNAQDMGKLGRPMTELFASKLALCNNAEIEISKLAASKASSDEVKQFAQMLAQDHAQSNSKLESFLPDYADRSHAPSGQPGSTRDGAQTSAQETEQQRIARERQQSTGTPNQVAQQQPGQQQPGQQLPDQQQPGQPQLSQQQPGQLGDRRITETEYRVESPTAMLRKIYEIAKTAKDNHVEACKEKLSEKSGAEFDKAFVTGQVASHGALIAELEALESHSDGEFQNLVREAKTSAEGHLKKAEQLCKQLEKSNGNSNDR